MDASRDEWFKKELTLKDVIVIMSVLVSVAINYTTTQSRIAALEVEIQKQIGVREKKFGEIDTKQTNVEIEIRAMRDASVARQEHIISRLVKIETILERVEKNEKK